MKKLLFLILLIPSILLAQQKPTEKKPPAPKYRKFVQVDVVDLQTCVTALTRWKELQMYDPKATNEQKVKTYQDIEAYLVEFLKKSKIDSVLVEDPKPKKP